MNTRLLIRSFLVILGLVTILATGGDDTTPNAFAFTNKTNIELSSLVISEATTITGINAPTSITVSNGEYSVNESSFTTTAATISNNDRVRVRHTSSDNHETITTTTLAVGGVKASFTSTTELLPSDTTPDSFSFNSVTDVSRNSVMTSNPVKITGINTPTPISVSNGEYSINEGGFSTTEATINNNDRVQLQHTASTDYGKTTTTTLTVGGEMASFSSMTKLAPMDFKSSVTNIDLRSIDSGESLVDSDQVLEGSIITLEQ